MKALLKSAVWIAAATLLGGLAGCAEREQVVKASTKKLDAAPHMGVDTKYAVKGFTNGDKTSWEQHMRSRAQQQDDYSKGN